MPPCDIDYIPLAGFLMRVSILVLVDAALRHGGGGGGGGGGLSFNPCFSGCRPATRVHALLAAVSSKFQSLF